MKSKYPSLISFGSLERRSFRRLVLLFVLTAIFSACGDPGQPPATDTAVQEHQPRLDTDLRFCTQLRAPSLTTKSREPFGVLLKDTKWRHDIRFPLSLTVRFLNGTDFQKNKVMEYAKEWNIASAPGWNGEHKIRIRFIPYDGTSSGNVADIRIWFQNGKGSSSYVGTEAKRIAQDQPTMFYGWITENEPEISIRQVVLHEFGHALGLVHEQQSPVAKIPWDKEKVYQYYHDTQDPPWTRQDVDANVFALYEETSTNHTAYDPTSIMHYAVPEELTIGDYSTPWNPELSPSDLSFIKEMYKYRPCTLNVDCCFDKKTGKEILCP